jgi:two-component system, chemotaxis family, sensor kinase CheA
MSDADEFLADFLEECDENLDLLEQELVALEAAPADAARLQSIFRTIHTIKGSCGFFGFSKLGALAHEGESLLGLIRDGKLSFNQSHASALLKMSDAIRVLAAQIEQTGLEGDGDYQALIQELQRLAVVGSLLNKGADPVATKLGTANIATSQSVGPVFQQTAQPSDEVLGELAEEVGRSTPRVKVVVEAVDEVEVEARHGTEEALEQHLVEQDNAVSGVSEHGKANQEATSIRVDVKLLDELMDLAGELVLARNELCQSELATSSHELSTLTGQLSLITSAIQDRVMRTRMQPIDGVFMKFKRMARDLAVQCGKQVRLELEGVDTELDRTLLEAIRDPLTHLVRNAIDHGIEIPEKRLAAGKPAEGKLLLRARHLSGQVIVEAIDDGGGIDVVAVREKAVSRGLISAKEAARATEGETLQHIFTPGFSTAKQISSISGRGVGMDVVKTEVEKIGGSVGLMSQLGVGTTLRITIPLTLAIVPVLMVRSAGQQYVIPQASLQEVILADHVETAQNVPVYRLRDRLLPLIWLDELLNVTQRVHTQANEQAFKSSAVGMHVAVLQAEDQKFGLVVDEVLNAQEVVVKPIGAAIKSIGVYSAATVLGDGTAVLILDIGGVARRCGLLGHAGESGRLQIRQIEPAAKPVAEHQYQWLVCAVGGDREIAIPLDSIERLDELDRSQIKNSDTGLVASYQGSVLPLVAVDGSDPRETETIPVVLHRRNDHLVGATVAQVIDIVHSACPITLTEKSGDPAIIGVTMAGGRVLDVVDLARLCR